MDALDEFNHGVIIKWLLSVIFDSAELELWEPLLLIEVFDY